MVNLDLMRPNVGLHFLATNIEINFCIPFAIVAIVAAIFFYPRGPQISETFYPLPH